MPEGNHLIKCFNVKIFILQYIIYIHYYYYIIVSILITHVQTLFKL